MVNWDILKGAISDAIKTNGNQEITGQLLQQVLLNIVTNVGANATFAGIATPVTNPGSPDGPVFYVAVAQGTYTNFGNKSVNGLSFLAFNNGVWTKYETNITEYGIISTGQGGFNFSERIDGPLNGASNRISTNIFKTGKFYIPIPEGYTAMLIYGNADYSLAGAVSDYTWMVGALQVDTTHPYARLLIRFNGPDSTAITPNDIALIATSNFVLSEISGLSSEISGLSSEISGLSSEISGLSSEIEQVKNTIIDLSTGQGGFNFSERIDGPLNGASNRISTNIFKTGKFYIPIPEGYTAMLIYGNADYSLAGAVSDYTWMVGALQVDTTHPYARLLIRFNGPDSTAITPNDIALIATSFYVNTDALQANVEALQANVEALQANVEALQANVENITGLLPHTFSYITEPIHLTPSSRSTDNRLHIEMFRKTLGVEKIKFETLSDNYQIAVYVNDSGIAASSTSRFIGVFFGHTTEFALSEIPEAYIGCVIRKSDDTSISPDEISNVSCLAEIKIRKLTEAAPVTVVGKNIVRVGENMDYEEIEDAIHGITDDSITNQYTILVYPKSEPYHRFSFCRDSLSSSYKWSDVVPRYISIIGIDKTKCIVESKKGDYDSPPAEILLNGIVKNLTFDMNKEEIEYTHGTGGQGGYAVHIDCRTRDDVGYNMTFEDCIFKSATGPAVGIGLHINANLKFNRCLFIGTSESSFMPNPNYKNLTNYGVVFAHTSTLANALNQNISFIDCIGVQNEGNNSLQISTAGNYSKETCECNVELIRNVFWVKSKNMPSWSLTGQVNYMSWNFGNNHESTF